MRTLIWVIALLVSFGVIAAFTPSMLNGDIVGFAVSSLFTAIGTLLVAARIKRLPSWGHATMKRLCWSVPVLALVGSLDYGIVSGQELFSLILAVLFGWVYGMHFSLPSPNPVERDWAKAVLFMACGKLHALGSGYFHWSASPSFR